jgi:hypothetical protein
MPRLVSQNSPDNGYNFVFSNRTSNSMASPFEIGNKPISYRIDESKDGSNYKNFVLTMGLEAQYSTRILYSKAKIIIKRRRSEEFVEINCKPYADYIDSTKNLEFYFPITPKTYIEIESIRKGGDLEVYLSIEEMFLHPFQMPPEVRRPPNQITKVYQDANGPGRDERLLIINYDTSACEDCKLEIFRDDWAEEVIEPLGMGERFIIEIPCKFPGLSEGEHDEKIIELKNNLEKGIELLQECIDEYNKTQEHKACIIKTRSILELLHGLKHDQLFEKDGRRGKNPEYIKAYKEYLIEKSKTGTTEVSRDIINNTFDIIDALFSISSKSVHLIGREEKEVFRYTPNIEDAQMLLGITSLLYNWIAKKLEGSAVEIKAESEAEGETEDA